MKWKLKWKVVFERKISHVCCVVLYFRPHVTPVRITDSQFVLSATPSREQLSKTLMQHAQIPSSQRGHKRSDKAHHSTYPQRANRLLRPVSRTEEELQQREQGWNDRFFYEEPSKSTKLARSDRIAATAISPDSLKQKEKKIQDERAHYGKWA